MYDPLDGTTSKFVFLECQCFISYMLKAELKSYQLTIDVHSLYAFSGKLAIIGG